LVYDHWAMCLTLIGLESYTWSVVVAYEISPLSHSCCGR